MLRFYSMGQWAGIKHDVIFQWRSSGGTISWPSDN